MGLQIVDKVRGLYRRQFRLKRLQHRRRHRQMLCPRRLRLLRHRN